MKINLNLERNEFIKVVNSLNINRKPSLISNRKIPMKHGMEFDDSRKDKKNLYAKPSRLMCFRRMVTFLGIRVWNEAQS